MRTGPPSPTTSNEAVPAEIKPEPWMWATDLSGGWFYRKGAVNRMSIPVMVGNAVDAISKNGVVMLNIALRGDGTLPENQAAYLTAFGDFLKINGEGIYGSRPWKTFGEGPLKMKDGRQGENHKDFSQQDIRFTSQGRSALRLCAGSADEGHRDQDAGDRRIARPRDCRHRPDGQRREDQVEPLCGWSDDPAAQNLAGSDRQRISASI